MSSHDPFVGQNLQIQIIKSNNPIGLEKKIFELTNNPILLNIENNDPFQ